MSPTPDVPRPLCPSCQRPFAPGRETCMWCGTALGHIEVSLQDYECPVCEGSLRVQEGDGWQVHICDGCTGIWMSAVMLHRLEKAYDEVMPAERPKPAGTQTGPPRYAEGSPAEFNFKYRRCPECTQIMTRKCYKVSGVILDECLGHGTWFDASEFEKVLGFLQAGGLKAWEKQEALRRSQENQPRYMKSRSTYGPYPGNLAFFRSFYNT